MPDSYASLFSVFLTCDFHKRNWTDDRPDFRLDVTFNCRFRSTASILTPNENNFVTGFGVFGIQDREREHLSLIRTVTAPRRNTDRLAVLRHLVIRKGRVNGRWKVEVLCPSFSLEHGPDGTS